MNPEAKEELDRLTQKDPKDLTKDEAKFIAARRDYLRPEQRQVFASILPKEEEPKEPKK